MNSRTSFRIPVPSLLATSALFAATLAASPHARADDAAAGAAGVDLDVAWCEGTGAQYIDTGIIGKPGVRAEATFAWTDFSGSDKTILGSRASGSVRCHMIAKDTNPAYLTCGVTGFWRCNKNNPAVSSTAHSADSVNLALYTTYTVTADFQANSQTIRIDGGDYSDTLVFNSTASMANTGYSLYALANNNAGTANQHAYARLYSLKIWQNDVPVRDFVPARQGQVYGLWEKVENRFYPSASSTPFVEAQRGVAGEPDRYVEWVQSNGSSTYVDTGLAFRGGTEVEAKCQWKAIKDSRLLGGAGKALIACGGTGGMTIQGIGTLDGTWAANEDYTVVADWGASAQSATISGPSATVTGTSSASIGTDSLPMYVFAQNNRAYSGQTAAGNSKARLYSMKIWQDGHLVRDYVPGIRNGEGCLYDRVGDVCYFAFTSAGAMSISGGMVGPPAVASAPDHPAYKLSYLGSLGNAYVDTGVIGKPYTKAEISFRFTGTTGNAMSLIGSRNTSLSSQRFVMFRRNESSNLQFASGIWANPSTTTVLAANTDYVMTSSFGYTGSDNHQVITLDGTKVHDGWAAMPDTGLPMFLLGHNVDGALSEGAVARIYYAKIWQRDANGNEQLVRNYVPVIADNGAAYLYDKVTKTFSQGGDAGLWDIGEVGERFHRGTSILIR